MSWERIVEFPPGLMEHERARYLWMVRMQLQTYDNQLGNKDIFRSLKKITLVKGFNSAALQNHNIGQEWKGNVNVFFNDDPSLDSYVTTHELAHYLMECFYPNGNERNDVVHWAANDATSKYRTYSTKRYHGSLREWLSTRTVHSYDIEFFRVDKLIGDTPEIMASIEKGTAPKGPNVYWTATPLSK